MKEEMKGKRTVIRMPKKRFNSTEDFESLGFEFLENELDKKDSIFETALLPKGWKMQENKGSYWTNIVDETGAVRATIYYRKHSFFGKEATASINLVCRYRVDFSMDERENHWVYIWDEKEKKELYSSPKCGKYGSSEFKKYFAEREEILKGKYPEFKNPMSYWD